MKKEAIDFLNWINNNFLTPVGTDGNFGLATEHPEFDLTIDELQLKGIYTSEDLYELFKQGKGVY